MDVIYLGVRRPFLGQNLPQIRNLYKVIRLVGSRKDLRIHMRPLLTFLTKVAFWTCKYRHFEIFEKKLTLSNGSVYVCASVRLCVRPWEIFMKVRTVMFIAVNGH